MASRVIWDVDIGREGLGVGAGFGPGALEGQGAPAGAGLGEDRLHKWETEALQAPSWGGRSGWSLGDRSRTKRLTWVLPVHGWYLKPRNQVRSPWEMERDSRREEGSPGLRSDAQGIKDRPSQ